MPTDPDTTTDTGTIFDLGHSRDEASIILIPAPYDATSSFGVGSALAPEAIRAVSGQVDLFDRRFGDIHTRGIYMEPEPADVLGWSRLARQDAAPIIARGGPRAGDDDALARVDQFSSRAASHVYVRAAEAYEQGKTPGVIGGEHAVAYGLYKTAAERYPGVGILQVDAHMDLRPAYEGFVWSHASVMHNVLYDLDGVGRIVQVGIRDYCQREAALAEEHSPDRTAPGQTSVITFFWDDIADECIGSGSWGVVCERIITRLPEHVVVSIDIDGLDPSLCPHTGTPVPGGLNWDQLSLLLKMIKESDRKVVGFDLVEVCPSPVEGDSPIDAVVGSRVLYRLCGLP